MIRFTPSSAVVAIIALMHDVLIMLSLTTIFRVQINTTFIAAIITIIGYSVNATIVIFDRIRELKPGANEEYQFTDALDLEASKDGALAYVFKGTRYDMGDRLGYLKANIEYGLRDEELGPQLKEYLKELV